MLMQYLTHTYLSESVVTLHCIIVEVEIEIDEGTCWGQQLNKRDQYRIQSYRCWPLSISVNV